jgi:Glycosyltransferase family 9 (heptosyltransferase)
LHLLTTYALACGAKISKPFIYEAYCPLPEGKYITFHTNTKFGSKNYDYWQEVINIISPILEKAGIKIVQTGLPNDLILGGVVDFRGKTTPNQLAYLISHSLLHFGSDSFAIHLASGYDINIVSLYNIIQPENAGPFFGTKEKQIVFKCYERLNQKPSYSPEENPKTINAIFPEEIAAAILKLLNIDFAPSYKTVKFGERYGKVQVNDFFPNQVVDVPNKQAVLNFRMDYLFNENALVQQLQVNKCRIFTNKPINLEIFKTFKPSIDSVFYFIDENDNPQFVKQLIQAGVNVALLSRLSSEEIQEKKINYYEFGNINLIPKPNPEEIQKLKKINNLYYKSCQTIHSAGKQYSCRAALELGIKKSQDFQPIIDNPAFWEESENFFFVEKLDKP